VDDLELNRFRKQDGRALLEQHSHCEVPAGCGGVVLRWVRPGSPMTVSVESFAHADAQVTIDGTDLAYGRAELGPGPHVLGVTLSGVAGPEDAVLLLALRAEHRKRAPIVAPAEQWQWRPSEPETGWNAVGAADEGWLPGVAAEAPSPRESFDQDRIGRLLGEGATPVGAGMTPPSTRLWFRMRFDLEDEA
jgi:hypothetical protein